MPQREEVTDLEPGLWEPVSGLLDHSRGEVDTRGRQAEGRQISGCVAGAAAEVEDRAVRAHPRRKLPEPLAVEWLVVQLAEELPGVRFARQVVGGLDHGLIHGKSLRRRA